MADSRLSVRLARLLVAAAWVDEELHAAERAFLRSVLESMPDITGADCADVCELLESPMETEAREQVVSELIEVVRTDRDKALVMDLLTGMIAADGIVRPSELALVEEVRKALDEKPTGLLGRASRLVGAMVRRTPSASGED